METLDTKLGLGKISALAMRLGLVGAISLSSIGCANNKISESEAQVLLGEVIALEAKDKKTFLAGQALKTLGHMRHEKDVAVAGRDEININTRESLRRERSYENLDYNPKSGAYYPSLGYEWTTKNPEDFRVVKIDLLDEYSVMRNKVGLWNAPSPSFAFRDVKDLNGDGYHGKEDYLGVGSYFKFKNSKDTFDVFFGSAWGQVGGKSITGKLSDTQTGGIIIINEDDGPFSENRIRIMGVQFRKGDGSEINQGIKDYTIEWLVDGKLIPTRTISVFIDYGK